MNPVDQTRLRFAVSCIVEGLLAILDLRSPGRRAGTPGEPADVPSLDPDRLQSLREWRPHGSPDAHLEVIDAFLSEGLDLIGSLRVISAEGRSEAMAQTADSLHWASRNVGAGRMAALTAALRDAALQGSHEQVASLLDETEAEFDRVRALLEVGRP